jgi:hypothetical protein
MRYGKQHEIAVTKENKVRKERYDEKERQGCARRREMAVYCQLAAGTGESVPSIGSGSRRR